MQSYGKVSSIAVHPEGKSIQAVAQVDIFHNYIMRNRNVDCRKVPYSLDAAADNPVDHLLGLFLGSTDGSDLDRILPDKVLQLIQVIDIDAPDRHPDQPGIDVKQSPDKEAVLFESGIIGKGLAEIARAENNDMMVRIQAQYFMYLLPEFTDIIAITLLSESSEAIEILSDLRGC